MMKKEVLEDEILANDLHYLSEFGLSAVDFIHEASRSVHA